MRRVIGLALAWAGVAACIWLAWAHAGHTPANAADVRFGPYDVRSVFFVAKSENHNEVHSALRLDSECRPSSSEPVFAYWRRLRKGMRYDEPLLAPGTRLYGPADAPQVMQSAHGGLVRTYVKALKRLTIDIRVEKTDGSCKASPTVTLKGQRAALQSAFLQLGRFGLTVKYVEVRGYRESDGSELRERFE